MCLLASITSYIFYGKQTQNWIMGKGEIVTYGVEDSHAIQDRARERIAEARAASEYVIIIGRLPSDTYTRARGSRGRSTRVRKSREAHWGAEGQ